MQKVNLKRLKGYSILNKTIEDLASESNKERKRAINILTSLNKLDVKLNNKEGISAILQSEDPIGKLKKKLIPNNQKTKNQETENTNNFNMESVSNGNVSIGNKMHEFKV